MITNVKGDLLKMFKNGAFDAIVHGCNCFHTMGAGIAGQIADDFPEAVAADKISLYGDIDKLGKYTMAQNGHGLIINGYTQYRPGREDTGRLYASIGTLFDNLTVDTFPAGFKVGIPMMGAGIAGGNWDVIEDMIRIRTPDLKVVVVEYVPTAPNGFNRNAKLESFVSVAPTKRIANPPMYGAAKANSDLFAPF